MEHFAKLVAKEQGTKVKTFNEKAIKSLQHNQWTGNIRELRNVVERLTILGQDPVTANDVDRFVK